MKTYRFSGLLAVLLACTGCSNLPQQLTSMAGTPKQFESRQIIVTLSENVRGQWQAIHEDILNRYDVQATGKFPLKSIQVNCLVYRVSDMVDIDEVKRRLSADPRIDIVQSNQVFDSLLDKNSKAYGELSYGPKMIQADLIHSKVTGKGITIAVIDTGADQNHPDLKGHILAGENFVEGGNASFAKDKHGTAIAGVIGARASNGMGIDGIAPDAKVDVYKACWYADNTKDKALCSSWTLAKAIDAAILNGSQIINLSLGGAEDTLLKKLLVTANQHHIVIVAAALENKPEPGFPASLDFVIPVISVDPQGNKSHPSWLSNLEVMAAPGIEVLTTAPGDSYDFLSGSSLAAAHVSGVAALLLQYQPKLEPVEVKSALLHSGITTGAHQPISSKASILINACRALASLGAAVNCP